MKMLRNELYAPWFLDEKQWGFQIIEGEFKDVSISIQNMELANDDSPDGNFLIDYTVISKPDVLSDDDLKTEIFKTVFTTIIEDILKEAVGAYEQDRNNDSEKSSSE